MTNRKKMIFLLPHASKGLGDISRVVPFSLPFSDLCREGRARVREVLRHCSPVIAVLPSRRPEIRLDGGLLPLPLFPFWPSSPEGQGGVRNVRGRSGGGKDYTSQRALAGIGFFRVKQ